ncbi:MAG: hypothetical protein Q9202_006457 [Teloschistes flavicans]
MESSTSQKDLVCFHFCRFDDQESLKASTIIGSIARQLVNDLPEDSFHDFEHRPTTMDFLKNTLDNIRQYFIILDGLDECSESNIREVSETLHSLLSYSHLHIKVFWCSRPNIPQWIRSKLRTQQHVSLETVQSQSQVASDIGRFIDVTLEEWLEGDTPRLQIGDPTLVLMIEDRLKNEAGGMFLWVKLQLQTLCQKKSDKQIIDTLSHLPKDLPETFERVLADITEPDDVTLGTQIFRWLAVAKRPLTVQELREAIGIEPLQDSWKPECLINDMRKAVACCGNLVFVDEEQQTVHFTHSSVRQFLYSSNVNKPRSRYYVDLDAADADAGAICVTYLNLPVFNKAIVRTNQVNLNPAAVTATVAKDTLPSTRFANRIALNLLRRPDKSSKSIQRMLEETASDAEFTRQVVLPEHYSFLSYAQQYWLEHTKQRILPHPGRLWRLWCNLLEDARWRDTLDRYPWTIEDLEKGSSNFIEWIAENNHCSLAQLLFSSGKVLPEENVRIIVEHAAARGHKELIEVSLTLSEIQSAILDCSLVAAAAGGHLAVVERLLQAKADVNAEPAYNTGRTALQAAAEGGHLAVVDRLLQAKADVDAKPASYSSRTALQAAAEGGHLAVVERLLQAKADVNAKPAQHSGRTAFQAAAAGHLAVLERLLQAKADVNAKPAQDSGRTALQAAAEGGHLVVLERLLQAKANVNAQSYDSAIGLFDSEIGKTALQLATEMGHRDVADRLRSAGAV